MSALFERYEDDGLVILAFPCNQFGAQEPGSNDEIAEFARSKYAVRFPMFSKIEVNGAGAAPLYQLLTSAIPGDDGKPDIPWNFAKFIVDGEGRVVSRHAPTVTPEDLEAEITALLGA